MANWLQRLRPKSAFARGVGVLVGGTAGAQLLTVLAAPLLTRLYSPEDFGLLAAFSAILALCIVAVAGRYELAIPIPEKESDAANLTCLSILIMLIVVTLASTVLPFAGHAIASVLNSPDLAEYLWLLPIAIFAVGAYEIFSKWALRKRDYKIIAQTRLVQSVGTVAIQVAGSALGVLALLGGQAVGQGLGASRLIVAAARNGDWRACSLRGMREQAFVHRRYPQYSLWSGLLNTASLQLAPLVFITIYGPLVAGLYALTLRVLSMPGSLIGNAIGSVFLAEAPDAIRKGEFTALVAKLHISLAKVAALPLVVLLFFGQDLFRIIFGPSWETAGTYAQMMAPWIYLQFQWAPLSMIGNLLELQRQILLSHIANLGFRFSVLAACAYIGLPSAQGVFFFSAASAFVYLFLIVWFFRKAGLTAREIILVNMKYVFFAALACTPIWMTIHFMS